MAGRGKAESGVFYLQYLYHFTFKFIWGTAVIHDGSSIIVITGAFTLLLLLLACRLALLLEIFDIRAKFQYAK